MRYVLAVLIALCALSLAGCGALGDFIATDSYDINIVNVGRYDVRVIVEGGHHDPYVFDVTAGGYVPATVNIQSWPSYGYSATGTQYRNADVSVTSGDSQGTRVAKATFHWPGINTIVVGNGGIQVMAGEEKPALASQPAENPNQPGLPPAEDPNQ